MRKRSRYHEWGDRHPYWAFFLYIAGWLGVFVILCFIEWGIPGVTT